MSCFSFFAISFQIYGANVNVNVNLDRRNIACSIGDTVDLRIVSLLIRVARMFPISCQNHPLCYGVARPPFTGCLFVSESPSSLPAKSNVACMEPTYLSYFLHYVQAYTTRRHRSTYVPSLSLLCQTQTQNSPIYFYSSITGHLVNSMRLWFDVILDFARVTRVFITFIIGK